MYTSRRGFLKAGALGSAGILLTRMDAFGSFAPEDELRLLGDQLIRQWGSALLQLQIDNPSQKALHGGIMCPACGAIHARCGDAVFPFLYLADRTKDLRYRDAAIRVMEWMENTVSMPDGSWLNEITVSDWKGTTVFAAVALAEALVHFGHLLDNATKKKWNDRLQRAADYVYRNFHLDYGNINYPVTAAYALTLVGKHLDQPQFTERGRELAQLALQRITPNDKLIYGEGRPTPERSAKGCYAVDLGYNVEETLPALAQYVQLTDDKMVKDALIASLRAHMEFMLPDGGWDNSWGTRNYKWTWWGSRTSDGCQPAYMIMSAADPAFYKVALLNTKLMAACTHGNMMYGGPDYYRHGIIPCAHHILGHSKALTTLLVQKWVGGDAKNVLLPAEKEYGVKAFPDLYTWLFSRHQWRGTVTGYDHEYTFKGGHATGGALTLLRHNKAGLIVVASMNRYTLQEGFNMQRDTENCMSLTPRFETITNGKVYTNISDLKARIEVQQEGSNIFFKTSSKMVDENQTGEDGCAISYSITDTAFTIQASCNAPKAKYILPLICTKEETVKVINARKLEINKAGGTFVVETSVPYTISIPLTQRIFNFVPGMEAIPVEFAYREVAIKISVKA